MTGPECMILNPEGDDEKISPGTYGVMVTGNLLLYRIISHHIIKIVMVDPVVDTKLRPLVAGCTGIGRQDNCKCR